MAKKPAKTKSPENTKQNAEQNAGQNQEAERPQGPRQIIMHAQYVKDISFENPNAVRALSNNGQQPNVEIGVQVNADKVNDEQFEVRLQLTANAKTDEMTLFLVELTYAGLVSAPDATPEEINPLVMIEGPRLLFPFARSIISNLTRDGGFMPLNLQPIDFVAVYRHSLEQQRKAATDATKQ
ncbi:MAG: protein-export chaperone SecB [Candidatus Puniceispirillaceae bacterium]